MFNRAKRASPQKRIDCLIGAGTGVRGDVMFTGGLRVDGQISGNVATINGEPGTLVLGEHARVEGKINVSHVVVNGTVNGPVIASGYLELQAKARVVGDVLYRRLEMHEGAVIKGRLNQGEPGSASVVELKRVVAE